MTKNSGMPLLVKDRNTLNIWKANGATLIMGFMEWLCPGISFKYTVAATERWASKNGYKEIVDLLLKHDEIVELLKRGNVTMNLQTKSGHTALSLASIHGHTDIVWELLKHDPFEALEWAITKCHATKCRESRRT